MYVIVDANLGVMLCSIAVSMGRGRGRNTSERRDVGGAERRVRARWRWGRPVATGPRSHRPCHNVGYNRT